MRYIIIFKYGKYKLSKLHIIFKESNESDFYIYIYIYIYIYKFYFFNCFHKNLNLHKHP